ncbi:TetR/AcrR family transcriptional regulator [Eubacterium ruminantium]|jgi:AcrR family transcriptional regulator|uniref:TetR/AcrR family transcriptional regulator n=1 Tax=Eubacterium ruminantium TaxID=42322 RepID=UPI00247A3113|nr:TetR/AcrR family transcriptional regulator [Eubacterium ruminantium]
MPKSQERCQEIREETRNLIIRKSVLYFAKNGFDGTKISDLSRHIGIAQGTIYIYFKSKEELYSEIFSISDKIAKNDKLTTLVKLPLPADTKIRKLSDYLIKNLKEDEMFSAGIALYTQRLLEGEADQSFYKTTEKIIKQGQKEGCVVSGNSRKLSELYWGVVYLYAVKNMYQTDFAMINSDDLSRVLLGDK